MAPGSDSALGLSNSVDPPSLASNCQNLHSNFWQNSDGTPFSINQSERFSTLISSNWEGDVFSAIVTAFFPLKIAQEPTQATAGDRTQQGEPPKRNGHALLTIDHVFNARVSRYVNCTVQYGASSATLSSAISRQKKAITMAQSTSPSQLEGMSVEYTSRAQVYECPLCRTFSTSTYRLWLSHLGQVHRNDSSFRVMCGYEGCAETKRSYSSLYSHIYRKHPELIRKRHQTVCTDEEDLPQFSSPFETTDGTVDSDLSSTKLIHCQLISDMRD